MAIITTYVCDVTGKSSQDKTEFVEVTISANGFWSNNPGVFFAEGSTKKSTTKFLHKDVAAKLGVLLVKKDEPVQPEPTFESKLVTLLKDYVEDIAYEFATEACSNYNQRG